MVERAHSAWTFERNSHWLFDADDDRDDGVEMTVSVDVVVAVECKISKTSYPFDEARPRNVFPFRTYKLTTL